MPQLSTLVYRPCRQLPAYLLPSHQSAQVVQWALESVGGRALLKAAAATTKDQMIVSRVKYGARAHSMVPEATDLKSSQLGSNPSTYLLTV